MFVQTLAIPGIIPMPLLYSNCHITLLTPPIEVLLSILEFKRHKLHIGDGLVLVPLSLHGWEAFPTPRALTHTTITWTLSLTRPQVFGVTPGSPLCPWYFGHSLWRGVKHLGAIPMPLLYLGSVM